MFPPVSIWAITPYPLLIALFTALYVRFIFSTFIPSFSAPRIRLDGVETDFDSHVLNKVLGYDSKRKLYYDKMTGQHLKIGTKLLVKIVNVDAINDNFSVKVLGMVNDNVKKKVLSK